MEEGVKFMNNENELYLRIFGKVVGFLLGRKDREGIYVTLDGQGYVCYIDKKHVKLVESELKDVPDGGRLTFYNTKKEAQKAAKENNEPYVDGSH